MKFILILFEYFDFGKSKSEKYNECSKALCKDVYFTWNETEQKKFQRKPKATDKFDEIVWTSSVIVISFLLF